MTQYRSIQYLLIFLKTFILDEFLLEIFIKYLVYIFFLQQQRRKTIENLNNLHFYNNNLHLVYIIIAQYVYMCIKLRYTDPYRFCFHASFFSIYTFFRKELFPILFLFFALLSQRKKFRHIFFYNKINK